MGARTSRAATGPLLFAAVQADDAREVARLLAEGAPANWHNHLWTNSTALHIAALAGRREILRLLLDHGADTEAKSDGGARTLLWAVDSGDVEIIRLLLDRGAKVDAKNRTDWTALHQAAERGQLEIVRLLLDRGADLAARTTVSGFSGDPRRHGARRREGTAGWRTTRPRCAPSGSCPVLARGGTGWCFRTHIVAVRARPACRRPVPQGGVSPLHSAAAHGRQEVARLLLERGADPLASDMHGQTAVAVCQGEACRRLMADSERLQRWHRRKQLATWRVGGV